MRFYFGPGGKSNFIREVLRQDLENLWYKPRVHADHAQYTFRSNTYDLNPYPENVCTVFEKVLG